MVPVAIGLWELMGILAATYSAGAALGWDLDKIKSAVEEKVLSWIVDFAAARVGLELDKDDPISDASFSHAITKRTGIAIRTLKDRDSIEEDLLNAAADRIYERTGVRFNNLRSAEQVKRDVVDFGVKAIAEKSGIVLTDPLNPDALRADVLAWGKEKVLAEIGEDMTTALTAEWSNGVSLLALMKQATGKDVTARDLMSSFNAVVMKHYAEKMERFGVVTKADRRRLQNKMNQRAFRERHKKGGANYDGYGLSRYIPLSSRG